MAGPRPASRRLASLPLERGFGPQALERRFACGREQMRVEIARIAAGKIPGRVNRDIEREPIALDQLVRKVRDQTHAVLGGEFRGQRHQKFAGDPRIFSHFRLLRAIPQTAAILGPSQVIRRKLPG